MTHGFEGFKPLGDRVLVERLPHRTSSIILLTDEPKSRRFKVLAVGPKAYGLEPGMTVVLPGCASDHPDFEENGLALIRVGDVGVKAEEEN